jgi:hemerythrin-like domain-containing protein
VTKDRSASVDAITLLQQDHDRVAAAFREFDSMDRHDGTACRQLIGAVCAALKAHSALEEQIFYPAVHQAIGDPDLMKEAAVEHDTARMLIEQLEHMAPDDPGYFATFSVLGEYVRHHIREEQEEMFPAVRKAGIDLRSLGERMRKGVRHDPGKRAAVASRR